jgi:hypothetical protein
MLRLIEEEVSLWSLGVEPQPFSLVVAKKQVILAQCEGVVLACLESTLGVKNGLAEQCQCSFHNDNAKKGVSTVTKLKHWQMSNMYKLL